MKEVLQRQVNKTQLQVSGDEKTLKTLAFLAKGYVPACWFFEAWWTLRKLMVLVIPIVLFKRPEEQVWPNTLPSFYFGLTTFNGVFLQLKCVLLLLIASLVIQFRLKPLALDILNRMEEMVKSYWVWFTAFLTNLNYSVFGMHDADFYSRRFPARLTRRKEGRCGHRHCLDNHRFDYFPNVFVHLRYYLRENSGSFDYFFDHQAVVKMFVFLVRIRKRKQKQPKRR